MQMEKWLKISPEIYLESNDHSLYPFGAIFHSENAFQIGEFRNFKANGFSFTKMPNEVLVFGYMDNDETGFPLIQYNPASNDLEIILEGDKESGYYRKLLIGLNKGTIMFGDNKPNTYFFLIDSASKRVNIGYNLPNEDPVGVDATPFVNSENRYLDKIFKEPFICNHSKEMFISPFFPKDFHFEEDSIYSYTKSHCSEPKTPGVGVTDYTKPEDNFDRYFINEFYDGYCAKGWEFRHSYYDAISWTSKDYVKALIIEVQYNKAGYFLKVKLSDNNSPVLKYEGATGTLHIGQTAEKDSLIVDGYLLRLDADNGEVLTLYYPKGAERMELRCRNHFDLRYHAAQNTKLSSYLPKNSLLTNYFKNHPDYFKKRHIK